MPTHLKTTIVLAGFCFAHFGTAQGQGLSLSKGQQRLIEGRLADQFNMTRLEAEADELERLKGYEIDYNGNFRTLAKAAALRHQIPPALFDRLIAQESNWNPEALSHKGAIGLAQLMPATARYLGVNPRDPRQNLEGGARYLREQYKEFGSWRLALAAYNAGPNAVKKYNGIPPYKETRNYIKIILGE